MKKPVELILRKVMLLNKDGRILIPDHQKLSQLVTESSNVKQLVSQIPLGIVYAVSSQLRDEYQRTFKMQNIDRGPLS